MHDPVATPDGYVFERAALEARPQQKHMQEREREREREKQRGRELEAEEVRERSGGGVRRDEGT